MRNYFVNSFNSLLVIVEGTLGGIIEGLAGSILTPFSAPLAAWRRGSPLFIAGNVRTLAMAAAFLCGQVRELTGSFNFKQWVGFAG